MSKKKGGIKKEQSLEAVKIRPPSVIPSGAFDSLDIAFDDDGEKKSLLSDEEDEWFVRTIERMSGRDVSERESSPLLLKTRAMLMIRKIYRQAEAGDFNAIETMVDFAWWATKLLSMLREKRAEEMVSIASESLSWPVLASRHAASGEDAKMVVKQLRLGEKLGYRVDETSKWRWDDFTHIAMLLRYDVLRIREVARNRDEHPLEEVRSGFGINAKVVAELPEWGPLSSAKRWWTVARERFLFAYPEPEKIDRLASLIEVKNRKSPSYVRGKIMRRIEERFLNFADETQH